MRTVNYELWMRRELWPLDAAVRLVLGFLPTGPYRRISGTKPSATGPVTQEHLRQIGEVYTDAIDAIELKILHETPSRDGQRREPQVRPAEFLAWAVERGLPIPDALHALVQPAKGESVTTKERTTFLVIIAMLAKMARVDCAKPSKAATSIVSMAEQCGVSIGQRTVEDYLKATAHAVGSRKR